MLQLQTIINNGLLFMRYLPLLSILILVIPSFANAQDGFTAKITGNDEATVKSDGVIKCMPAYNSSYVDNPSYYFLADGQGIRDYGITFTIPMNTQAGKYDLIDPKPFETGKNFGVRVDIERRGNKVDSFNRKTEGYIKLDSTLFNFPSTSGSFAFSISDKRSKRITVEGNFNILASKNTPCRK